MSLILNMIWRFLNVNICSLALTFLDAKETISEKKTGLCGKNSQTGDPPSWERHVKYGLFFILGSLGLFYTLQNDLDVTPGELASHNWPPLTTGQFSLHIALGSLAYFFWYCCKL